jgi:hypothetical protein
LQKVYQQKIATITKWYEGLEAARKNNPNPTRKDNKGSLVPVKRAELKPLEYYIKRIKQVMEK